MSVRRTTRWWRTSEDGQPREKTRGPGRGVAEFSRATVPRVLHLLDMQLVGIARRAAMFGAVGLETGTDLAKLTLVAANREKWKRSQRRVLVCGSDEKMDKRELAKARYEARSRRAVEEEKKDEQE